MEIEGIADLPLHTGHVPPWLAPLMKRLAKAIIDTMVVELGPEKTIERFSNPLWFQAFNNAIGMDWDSSGSTTVTTGILKEVVNPQEHGFSILGGKGSNALKVPEELLELSGIFNIDPDKLARISKVIAKVDTTLVQDGHQLYHHSMFVTSLGKWVVVQQGMNLETRFARRYHWKETNNFVVEPHSAIAGTKQKVALNAIKRDKEEVRRLILDLIKEEPRRIVSMYERARAILNGQNTLDIYFGRTFTIATSPQARLIYYKPVDVKRVMNVLRGLRDVNPNNLEEALYYGLGPSTTRALLLISDLIYNEPPSYEDPVTHPYDPFKYAFAVGGKDGIPFPVNFKVAEEVIYTLEDFVTRAKLEEKDKEFSLKKLKQLITSENEGKNFK